MGYDKDQMEEKALIKIADQVNEMGFIWREQPKRDLGIDGQIETKDDEKKATGKLIAVQSKGGKSYIRNEKPDGFTYYADLKHVEYWKNHSLPVLIIVYHPDDDELYWVDAQKYFKHNPKKPKSKSYPFRISKKNVFSVDSKDKLIRISSGKTKEILERYVPLLPQPYFAHHYILQKNFTGRVKEREQLTEWFNSGDSPMFAYIAIGGMGKSALTWHWLQEDVIKKDLAPDGIIWWSFYEKESSFENFLNKSIQYASGGKINPSTINSPRDKIDVLYNLLYKESILLVFDGLERVLRAYAGMGSPYQGDAVTKDERQDFRRCIDPNVGFFLQKMASGLQTKTLVTSRLYPKELDDLEGCRQVNLETMEKADAVKFFHRQGVKGTRTEIQKVCDKYGYHPLCLRLLSGWITEDPEYHGDIVVWKEYNPLPKLKPKKHHILELAYKAIGEEKQKFISKLASFRTPMEYKALEIFNTFGGRQEFNRIIKELVNRGLLFFDKEYKKYDLHPIVRSYCYDRLKDKEGVHSELRDYFASVPEPDKIESIDDLQPVIELYHHTVGAGRYDEACDLYFERLSNIFLYQFGAYNTMIELTSTLFPDGLDKPPKLSKESDQAYYTNHLAISYSFSGQPRRAVPVFDQAVKFAIKMGNQKNLAIGLGNLASPQIVFGDLESTESNLRRRIEIDTEIENRKALDLPYSELGRVLSYRGDFKEATTELQNAMNISKEFNATQSQSVIWAYCSLHAFLMDDPKEALKCAIQALEFAWEHAKKMGRPQPNPRDFIRTNWLIGASYVTLQKPADAEKYLNFAITECRKINMVDHEAQILLSIAKLRHIQKKDEESLKFAEEALEIANRCDYVFQQADIHLFLAEFYKDKSDIEEARKHVELAKLRSHQMINVETGDYITKPEDTEWKYKPCYDKAVSFLQELDN